MWPKRSKMTAAAEPETTMATAAAPAGLVSLTDIHAVLAERHGWPVTHMPRRHGDPILPVLPAQQETYVRARAESLGLPVVDGWGGRPAMATADADRFLAAQREAEAESAERERRDAAASAEAEAVHDPSALRVSELVGFFGPGALSNAARPGGYGIPGPIHDQAAFQAAHAPELAALAASQGSLSATVAPPTPPDDEGW
jgi:hypothetical protein